MTEIYHAGSQRLKVRAIAIFSLLVALVALWVGWGLFQTYGLRPADGGMLAPLSTRIALGGGVAALGIAFAAGMAVYGRCYVTSMRHDPAGQRLHFTTIGLIAGTERSCPLSAVESADYVAGQAHNTGGVSVNAPWIKLRIAGQKLPLILDAQGVFPDPSLAERLLKLR